MQALKKLTGKHKNKMKLISVQALPLRKRVYVFQIYLFVAKNKEVANKKMRGKDLCRQHCDKRL